MRRHHWLLREEKHWRQSSCCDLLLCLHSCPDRAHWGIDLLPHKEHEIACYYVAVGDDDATLAHDDGCCWITWITYVITIEQHVDNVITSYRTTNDGRKTKLTIRITDVVVIRITTSAIIAGVINVT